MLAHCLEARPWPEHLLDELVAQGGDRELFRIVVERLADLFEPRLCSVYAELFSQVIARRIPACMPSTWWRDTSGFGGRESLDRDPEFD